ncbi:IS3 family transposase, partial [Rubrivivax gelatinosus]|uniref:IS3 family transposase n=1 Tax=Rubrivivax gelatinosus TaxID=28068 RepID=UPI001FB29F8F
MAANRKTYSVQVMCAHLRVSRSGYYAWTRREPSKRAVKEAELIDHVRRIHAASRGYYGSPRIRHALRHEGLTVARSTVARVMRRAQLQGRSARLYRRSRVGQRAFFTSIANRQRGVKLERLNQIWVGDVTYLRLNGHWRYLAVVMDKHSRRIIGWSLGSQRDAALTLEAFNHAWRGRKPESGLIFHSDRGIEYAAHQYRQKLQQHGVVQSMNRPGKMNDNAHMESFFHSMKSEHLYGQKPADEVALRNSLLSYIQFYNQQRLHSSIGYLSPAGFERSLVS